MKCQGERREGLILSREYCHLTKHVELNKAKSSRIKRRSLCVVLVSVFDSGFTSK